MIDFDTLVGTEIFDMSIGELKSALRFGTVEVTFTKKDGTLRVMRCTTKSEAIALHVKPSDPEKETKTRPTKPENLLRVLDTDIGEFRSFNFDQVVSWK
jgi:hypothetical protein